MLVRKCRKNVRIYIFAIQYGHRDEVSLWDVISKNAIAEQLKFISCSFIAR